MSAHNTFILFDAFTIAHFDNSQGREKRQHTHDGVMLENVIRRVAVRSRSGGHSADDARVLNDALAMIAAIARRALNEVNAEARLIDKRFSADPLAGELIDHPGGTEFALRWNDERMWIMVRTLLAIDTAHRQLVQLKQRGAFDINELRRLRTPLIRPWRRAIEDIVRVVSSLPRHLRKRTQGISTRSEIATSDEQKAGVGTRTKIVVTEHAIPVAD